jgi:hypothetical protein
MSKRSENFKKSKHMKSAQNLYLNELKTNCNFDELLNGDVISIIRDGFQNKLKEIYNEEIALAYKNGYSAARDENEKDLKDAFNRGVKYGREQRENELKNKYDFIEKGAKKDNPVKEARDKYSMNAVYPQFQNHRVKSFEEIFEDVDKIFNQVFGFKK